MDANPEAILDALESGATDRVNDAIEAAEDADTETQVQLLSECFDACRRLYNNSEDGYQRQAVVRFLDVADPNLAVGSVNIGRESSAANAASELTPEDLDLGAGMDDYRDALVEFYLTAIRDEDGRVRNSAVRAIRLLAIQYEMLGEDVRLEALSSRLDDLTSDTTGEKRKHIADLREDVQAFSDRETGLRSSFQQLLETTQNDDIRD